MIETIEWVPVAERLPDDEQTVLICTTGTAEPVWLGYYYTQEGRNEAEWRDTEGDAVNVTHWSPMPAGPRG